MNNTETSSNEKNLEWLDDTLIYQHEASFIKYFREKVGKIERIESRELFEEFTEVDFTLPGIYEHSVYAVEKKHIVSLYLVATEFLTEIEEETVTKIAPLIHLVYLCLNICKIPNKFPILPNLSKLFLLSCTINTETLFKDLYELSDLFIINSFMPKLPDSIYELDLLFLEISVDKDSERNYFQKNCLKQIPNKIGKLRNLMELHIHNTSLKSIPESIGELKKLKVLYITSCGISSLPDAIGDLSSLEETSFTGNELSDLPESFFHLKALKELSINYNKFESLPKSLNMLSKLEQISLIGNPFRSTLFELEQLAFLKLIFIDDKNRKLLPKTILEKEKKDLIEIL